MLSPRFYTLAWCALLICGVVGNLAAQDDADISEITVNLNGVSTSVIEDQARKLLLEGKFAQATPFLKELYDRLRETEEDMTKLESIYYHLALGYFAQDLLERGIQYMEEYRERFPEGANYQDAMTFLADAYRSVGRFSDAIPLYRELLLTQRSRNQNSYRLNLLEHISDAYFYDRPLVEIEEENEEGETVIRKEPREPLWDEAIPAFEAFIAASTDPAKRARIGSYLLQGYIAKERFEDAFKLLPVLLVNSPSRYDIAFNVALLEAGDQMFRNEDYARAAFFYALTLPKERIKEYFTRGLENLKQQKIQRENNVLSSKLLTMPEIERGIRIAEAQLEILETLPNYTSALRYRWARTFLAMGRDWEGYWAFLRLWEEMPEDMSAEEFLYTAFAQAAKIKENDKALELGEMYYNTPAFKKFRDSVVVSLAQLYNELGQIEKFNELTTGFIEQSPSDSVAANGLVYLRGAQMIKDKQFTELKTLFDNLYKQKGEASIMAPGLMYWSGMACMMLEEYDEAIKKMERLCELFPYSPYAEDALFRIGIAHYGKLDVKKAEQHFLDFVLNKPDSVLRPEAEAFLGDIAASQARVDDALEHYENVQKYTKEGSNIAFVSHAVFQAAKLYEANKRYGEMNKILSDYINRYKDEADISNAVYQLGRSYELAGNPDEAMDIYFDAVKLYGHQKSRVGIDYIIGALPEQYKKLRGEYPIQQMLEMYEQAVKDRQWTKVFRLESALEQSGHKITTDYQMTPEILEMASPSSLVYLAHRYADDEYLRDRAFKILMDEYADTDFVRIAYMELGDSHAALGENEKALEYYELFSNQFPMAPEAGLVELHKAETLIKMKRYKEAREVLENIRRVREWRGKLYGEAVLMTGMMLYEQQNWPEAHALFQQAYSAYGGYPDIAARAFLWAGNSLERMGDREQARKTYEAFMRNPNLKDTEQYEEIRNRLNRI
jgi:TolA-binding protein